MTPEPYDVIVLGGGAGGVPAAIRAAQLGGKVAIIERDHLGGLCMNRGCIPFGHMMAASRMLGNLSLGKEMGLNISSLSKDYETLLKRQDELISFMRQGVEGMLKKNRVDIIQGEGKLTGKGRVAVNGTELNCRNMILASGARWRRPEVPGADVRGVIHTDKLLDEQKLPKRSLLIGGSPWIMEIAQFMKRFDCSVTLVTHEKGILFQESKLIRTRLSKSLTQEGINIHTHTAIKGLKRKKDGLHALLEKKGREEGMVVGRVIWADRTAALTGLGLDTVGLDEKAPFIEVDDRMATSVEGVYAIGDMAGPETRHYSHAASGGGIIAAENAMGMDTRFDHRTVTRILFTQPQVACVGLTPKDAKKKGYEVITGSAPLSMNPLGMLMSQNNGMVEVVAEKRYGEILGVHMIGEGVSEMAGQAVLAIQMEGTVEELARATFPHPTLSESLVEAARECLGRPIFIP